MDSLLAPESASFAGTRSRRPPRAFEERQRLAFADDVSVYDAATRRFVHGMVDRGASPRQILDVAIDRARAAPGRRSLQRLRTVAGEVGRLPGGARVLRARITARLADELSVRRA